MLVLEGKSRNRLVLQMGSGKVVYWPPCCSPSSYQQCSTRLSGRWRLHTVQMGDGFYIQSRQSADLFNVAHFRAKTQTIWILMRELLFTDGSALVAHFAEEVQKIVDAFSGAPKKLGLKINTK